MKRGLLLFVYIFLSVFTENLIFAQTSCDYLIISPDIFLQNSYWSSDLVNLQISRGFHPVVVSVTSNTTNDQIRSIITNYYNNSSLGLKYVLLIGNGKNNNLTAPSLNIYYQYEQHGTVNTVAAYESGTYIPFYSVHCNTYWNPNGVDVASDEPYVSGLTSRGPVYIGRIPASSSQEISNFVNKLKMYYQNKNISTPYGDRELMLNLDVTFPSNLCTGSLVKSINSTLIGSHIPGNFSLTQLKVSEHYNGLDDFSDGSAFGYSPDRELLFENNVNSGVSIISLLSTMGGPVNFGGWYWSDKSTFNFNNNNTSLPFLIAPNCEQGSVNHPTDESVVRRLMVLQNGGIIGAIAPTENSEQHANGYVLNRFHDLIFQDESLTYGQINSVLKNELKTNYKDFEYFYNSLTLFGDPSMVPSVYKHRSSNIISSTTWNGNIIVDGNISVASGVTLNIVRGTNILFKNNSSLVVNGSLNANGATFDFVSGSSTYSNGIKLLPGSTAAISNSTIKNAYRGIDLNQAYLSLSGCNITGCSSLGIYMYNENGASNRSVISDCNIYSNTATGVVLYYSSPIIIGNYIYSNYYGMGISDYSAPSLGYMGAYGNNNIFSNRCHGLSANRNSNPFLGENICMENGGHNRIEKNTPYNVSVYGNSIVTAENNWWEYLSDNVTINTAKFYVSSGVFDYYPPADPGDLVPYGDPNIISGLPSDQISPEVMLYDGQFTPSSSVSQSKEGINDKLVASAENNSSQGSAGFKAPSSFNEKWSVLKKLTYARYMHFLNKDLEAEEICKKVIESFPDSSLSYYALDILWQSARKSRIEDFKNYLNFIKSHLDRKPAGLMAEILQARFDKENRIKLLDELSSKIKNMALEDLSPSVRQDIMESLLFSKLLHYLNDEKNVAKAKDMVSEIDVLVGPGSHSSVEAHSLIGEIIPENDMLTKDLKSSEESALVEKPTEYSLSGNYPNPFNPSTRIDYTLPMISKVELRVYDILGHEVVTLVNSVQEAGRYSVMFNASDVSSGLYIYKIRSKSLENGKVFEKTGKMMFMK